MEETKGKLRPSPGDYLVPIPKEQDKGIIALLKKASDFLFPRHLVCHCCDREAVVNEYGICSECEKELELAPNIGLIEYVDGHASGLLYRGAAANAIKSFKYDGQLYKKEMFIPFMQIPAEWAFDYVISVPLHPKRERSRGYNQSEVLASAVAARYGLKSSREFLSRKRDTPKQALMNTVERSKNLKDAFSASPDVKGRGFLLIDDVYTTGATLSECARTLKKQGAVRVYALTACSAANVN